MQQRKLHFYLIIGIFLSVFLLQSLEAKKMEVSEEKAFYAISSLKFYLKETLAHSSENTSSKLNSIHFQDSDIAHLWNVVSSYPAIQHRIQEARNDYEESLNSDKDSTVRMELRQRSQAILEVIWEELNPYILKGKATDQGSNMTPFHYPNFDNNPFITKEMRKEMRPYLLPTNNPLKAALDHLFQGQRLIQNETSFIEAGFITLHHQPFSKIRVAKHANLPGYLFKVYLDSDPYEIKNKACWWRLTQRCKGAKNIRRLIKEKNLVHFTVPDKWLYPLSTSSLSSKADRRSIQPVILVVTDMDLVSSYDSVEAWKTKVTPRILDELYCILSHGFASEYLTINIPYCKNGKFACVDTEDAKKELKLDEVKNFIAPEMHGYWDELVRKGGKI